MFYGQSIHDRCYRRPFYERGQFAESFDDEGAKKGWCLYKLGCKGPTTYNACATVKWNNGTSFPIEAGHGCIGCAEPDFWDKGGFYNPLSVTDWGTPTDIAIAAGAGIALGAAAGVAGAQATERCEGDSGDEAVNTTTLARPGTRSAVLLGFHDHDRRDRCGACRD